jgi:hypothetical protein
MGRDLQAMRLKAIGRLCQAVRTLSTRAWYHRAVFGTGRRLVVDGVRTQVSYGLHVLSSGATDGPLASNVAIWANPKGKPRPTPEWYKQCERLLYRHGYRGRWRGSPSGRIGDFWRRHKDVESLVAEAAALDSIVTALTLMGAPSNKRMQLTKRGSLVGARASRAARHRVALRS